MRSALRAAKGLAGRVLPGSGRHRRLCCAECVPECAHPMCDPAAPENVPARAGVSRACECSWPACGPRGRDPCRPALSRNTRRLQVVVQPPGVPPLVLDDAVEAVLPAVHRGGDEVVHLEAAMPRRTARPWRQPEKNIPKYGFGAGGEIGKLQANIKARDTSLQRLAQRWARTTHKQVPQGYEDRDWQFCQMSGLSSTGWPLFFER